MLVLFAALVLFVLILVGVCAYAFVRGGPSERAGAAIIVIAALASQVASLLGNHWSGPEYYVMAVDVLTFVAFVALAYRSRKFWPIWAAAAQLVGTLTHLAPLVVERAILFEAYTATQPFWAFPVLLALFLGTRAHAKHRA